jgi:hypothetical protein
MKSGSRRAMPTLPGTLRTVDFVTIEQPATRGLASRYLNASETIEVRFGSAWGLGVAAMKCQSYQYSPCFENAVCKRCSRRRGFVHGLIDDAR